MATAVKTDHSEDIQRLREDKSPGDHCTWPFMLETAADLLEMHDRQSLSLDEWSSARTLVEYLIGHSIQENHV